MVIYTLSQSVWEFAKSRVIQIMCDSVVYVLTCKRTKRVPASHFYVPINLPICQRCANYSTCPVNVPKMCQFSNFACQKAYKRNFQQNYQIFDFSIMLNICQFQQDMSNSRKLISQGKQFKFRYFQTFVLSKQGYY